MIKTGHNGCGPTPFGLSVRRYNQREKVCIRSNCMQMNSGAFLSSRGPRGAKSGRRMGRCCEDIEVHWSVLLTDIEGGGFYFDVFWVK